jgi:hypothetical protein
MISRMGSILTARYADYVLTTRIDDVRQALTNRNGDS